MLKNKHYIHFLVLLILAFASCKSPEQLNKDTEKTLKASATTVLGKEPIQSFNEEKSLVLYQADFKPSKISIGNYCRFLVYDKNSGKEVFRSKQNVKAVKWQDNDRLLIEVNPGTVMKGKTPERRYIWNVTTNTKEALQPSTTY